MKVKNPFLVIPGNRSGSNRLYGQLCIIGSKLELETSSKENSFFYLKYYF